jgi:hypothetical protein
MSLFGKKTEPAEWGVPTAGGSAHPYGIEETIRLMRGLPVDQNLELVVRVVKTTLESVRVRLPTIIQEATKKQQFIAQQIAGLSGEIAGFEAEIAKRRQAIDHLEQDLAETTKVKERLELAEGSATPPPLPPAQPPSAGPLPSGMPPLAPPKPPPLQFRPVVRPRTTPWASDDTNAGVGDAKGSPANAKPATDDTKPVKSGGNDDDDWKPSELP